MTSGTTSTISQAQPVAVCFLIGSFHPMVGGGETHARLLGQALTQQGVRVTVITRRTRREWAARETLNGFVVHRVAPSGFTRMGKYLMLIPVFWKLIRLRKEYDVIYVCGLRVLGLAGLAAGLVVGKPCVLRAEACGEWSGDFIFSSPGGAIRVRGRRLIRGLLSLRNRFFLRATRFLSISRVIRDEFTQGGVPPAKIVSITNGIDAQRFQPPAPGDRERLRAEFQLPGGFLFAYAGKLNRGKGLEMLLRAWRSVRDAYPQAHLVLIGSGGQQFLSCEAELRAFVSAHGLQSSVTFTGYTSRVADYLRACDGFVFPSESEALGLALIEAMACGLPSIASATGGILDIVTDRQNGRLVPVGDEHAWLDAMKELMERPDLARQWAEAGRRSVLQNFDIRTVATAHLDLFRSLRTN